MSVLEAISLFFAAARFVRAKAWIHVDDMKNKKVSDMKRVSATNNTSLALVCMGADVPWILLAMTNTSRFFFFKKKENSDTC